MDEIGPKTVEVFAGGIGVPVKASYCIAVVPYPLMKCCPVSARMCNAGGPFLLKSFGVLVHILFIAPLLYFLEFIWDISDAI